uniref:Late embryogenesis abundant protein LEA-2 subgroup domain-containing protein n=1 Tax=Kalanchoe fedtschenkoi TaxID=63787 RepID=A0A7N1A2J6_KALFE
MAAEPDPAAAAAPPTNPKPPKPKPPTAAAPPPAKQQPFPPTQAVKLQIRDPNPRPTRPKSAAHKKRLEPKRSCCTCCCCMTWIVVTVLILSVAAAAACGVFWIMYRPQRPRFTVASLRLGALNLTGNLDADAAGRLFTSGNLTVSAKNPNSKITAFYDAVAMSAFSRSNVVIASSTFRPFTSPPGSSTVMRFAFRSSKTLDLDSAKGLRSDLKGRSVVGTRVELETKMGVKFGKWKTTKIGIKVTCGGVRVRVPNKVSAAAAKVAAKAAGAAITDDGKCEVDLSIKIWGFTF